MLTKKNSSVQQNSVNAEALMIEYCKDINQWPNKWEIGKADLKIGQSIVDQLKPFLIDSIEKGRSKKTIKTYAQYLWVLGGELIRQINDDPHERRLSARNLILKYIDDSGGPYWRHARDELEHARYDSICKRLFKFMTADST